MNTLAQVIGEYLSVRQQSLALAESCTGGLVAKRCTDIAGSSAWFERGYVTYSNRAKQELLGVPEAVLNQHGAVSEACAQAMVEGLLAHAPVDWGVSVTGIAGPTGGSADKPVGLVWMACKGRGSKPKVERHQFSGDREAVRDQAAQAALQLLLGQLRHA